MSASTQGRVKAVDRDAFLSLPVGRDRRSGPCTHRLVRGEPSGYLAWHEWAERKSRTHEQTQCPKCGLWVFWRKRAAS